MTAAFLGALLAAAVLANGLRAGVRRAERHATVAARRVHELSYRLHMAEDRLAALDAKVEDHEYYLSVGETERGGVYDHETEGTAP